MPSLYDLPLDPQAMRFNDDISTMVGIERVKRRQLYIYGDIEEITVYMETPVDFARLTATDVTRIILDYNEADKEIPSEKRTPIRLFMDSPGGDSGEGFALAKIIELSKTPVWTINIGQWSSMAFLIGIAGHRRLSIPTATFLWHDGSTGYFGSSGKVQDTADFNKRYEREVVREHVLRHCNRDTFTGDFYDAHVREEFYMLPEDALKFGFIDEIITDLSILS